MVRSGLPEWKRLFATMLALSLVCEYVQGQSLGPATMVIKTVPIGSVAKTSRTADTKEMVMKTGVWLRPIPDGRVWITPEYVHYWQNTTAKLPQLLSVANGGDTLPVANFYGNKGVTWSNGNGVRLTLGGWIDDQKLYGAEISGLYILSQSQDVSFNPAANNADAFFTSFAATPPKFLANQFPLDPKGTASYHYGTVQLGGEANGLYRLHEWEPAQGLQVRETAMAGLRYFGLKDDYSDSYSEPTPPTFFYNDSFKTDNNFLGANLGVHVRAEYKNFYADLTPKIALGGTDESVGVNGSNSVSANPKPGGFYASGNKPGTRSRVGFAYLPEITLKLGYDFNKNAGIFVGYDALYLSDVARVEDQISTQLDGRAVSGFTASGNPPPDASPAPKLQSSSLFEQGVTAGLTFKL